MRATRLVASALALVVLAGTAARAQSPAGATHLLVVSGAGGEPQYREAFHTMGARLAGAAVQKLGVPAANVVFLAEDSTRAPAAGRSSRAGIERAIAAIAGRAKAEDRVVIVLVGHGSQRGDDARFNLPGPDITAAEFARLLSPFGARMVAVVNTASASGDWVPALSGKNRVVVTATKSGAEGNATLFPRHFVEAYAGDGADADKDGAVSLLEAYEFARREVARAFEGDNRLLTEHAQLDDDGDGKGTAAPARTGDGQVARRVFLRAGGAAAGAGDARLLARRDSLQRDIEALRARKASMTASAYDAELERLLLALATANQALRQGRAP